MNGLRRTRITRRQDFNAAAVAATIAIAACVSARSARAGSVDVPLQIGGAYSVPVKSLKERRFEGTVRQGRDFSCGSAAIATLLTAHYGEAVGEQTVFDAMLALGDADKIRREGFSLLDMKRYLATRGFEADGFEASVATLAEAGLPAIALVNEKGYHHFVVIKGVRRGRVLVGDPADGTRAMPVEQFESKRVNAILFVIGNRQEAALFDREVDWAALPAAPIGAHADGGAAMTATLPKLSSGDF